MKFYLCWLREYLDIEIIVPQDVVNVLLENGFESYVINDNIVNVEIPFNRTDCLSIYGLTQELNSYFRKI